MSNLQLKKNILEVVDNQLKSNDPPCTKDIYNKLLVEGYSKSEAKDKIGAVVLDEIYDILKDGKPFDKAEYQLALEEMFQNCINFEDYHHIRTEWDEWDDLAQAGYECFEEQNSDKGLKYWDEAWVIFQNIIGQQIQICSLLAVMEEQNYTYAIDCWLQDYEMELGNAGRYEERIALCRKILELFDWQEDDDSCFQCAIGDSLFYGGKKEEACNHYEKWLAEDPQNSNGINGYCWLLTENGEIEKAYEVLRRAVWGIPCYADNAILFMRAKHLAQSVGKQDESQWYEQQLNKFQEGFSFKKIPVVKPEKIYPNDPCPCGSGKKYKKCCGKK